MIISFGYKKSSGKDTAATYLKYNHRFVHRAFATPLKQMCRGLVGKSVLELETEEQKEQLEPITGLSYRRILQKLGDSTKKEFGEDIFCKLLNNEIQKLITTRDIAISDLRSKREFEYIHSVGGYNVKIIRPSVMNAGDTHRTELELDSIPNDEWDYILYNDGDLVKFTNDLTTMVHHFGFNAENEEVKES